MGSDLRKVDRHRIMPEEYEEAPELTPEQIANAIVSRGEVPVRRGRPRLDAPKEAVKLRIDSDVLSHYRKSGPGWQTRINNDLRRASVDKKTRRRA
jgi:uncharacterized protein (DUF4415 family)